MSKINDTDWIKWCKQLGLDYQEDILKPLKRSKERNDDPWKEYMKLLAEEIYED